MPDVYRTIQIFKFIFDLIIILEFCAFSFIDFEFFVFDFGIWVDQCCHLLDTSWTLRLPSLTLSNSAAFKVVTEQTVE